jgi:hypothetical protein
MSVIDRRSLMRSLVGGAAVAALGVTAVGVLASVPLQAAPLPADKLLPAKAGDLIQQAQVVYRGRRRRRRWVCWWRGRRRVCGWRWV